MQDAVKIHHGGDVWGLSRSRGTDPESILDFSASINDFLPPIDLLANITNTSLKNYPDPDVSQYLGGLTRYTSLTSEEIAFGPGLTYFIHRLAELFSGRKILLLEPSFLEFKKAFSVHNASVKTASSSTINSMEKMILDHRPEIIVITRPESPTGTLMPFVGFENFLTLAEENDVTVIADEAFLDFVGVEELKRSAALIRKHDRLILGRSLTKILGIPGLRAGYLASSPAVIDEIREKMEPWPICQPALDVVGSFDYSLIEESVAKMKKARDFLEREMVGRGFQPVAKSSVNFISFRIPDSVDPGALNLYLMKNNILVRFLDDYREFGNRFIRIAVKKEEKSAKLVNCLDSFIRVNI